MCGQQLTSQQEALLARLAEARSSVQRRRVFIVVGNWYGGESGTINHPGLPDEGLAVNFKDVQELIRAGMLSINLALSDALHTLVDVSIQGLEHVQRLENRADKPG